MLKYQYIHELIDFAFKNFPNNDFCDDLKIKCTYEQFALEVQALQYELHELGIKPYDRIVLCTSKTVESLAALLAIMNNGSCIVPLDTLSPTSRKLQVIRDCNPQGLLIDKEFADELCTQIDCNIYTLEGTAMCYLSLHSTHKVLNESLAYILYTSGSTGVPKGVMVTHQNILSFIEWAAQNFDFNQSDIFASVAPFHFDLSVFDIFVSLWHGSKLVLFDDKHIRNPLMLTSMIEQKQITVWYSTPTVLVLMNQYGKMYKYDHQSLRKVFYAGEIFPFEGLIGIKAKWKQADFYNFYGPTETNVCTWIEVPKVIDQNYNTSIIGQSCEHLHCQVYTEGEIREPLAGLKGELIVSGAAVSAGYFGLESDSYFEDKGNQVWYKTGDWVYVTENLQFNFLGRKDRMIKRRGHRIELDEIQKAIEKHEQVIRAGVVYAEEDNQSKLRMVFEAKDQTIDMANLKQYLAELLPIYMLPDSWHIMDRLPMTSTHKIDYQALVNFNKQ